MMRTGEIKGGSSRKEIGRQECDEMVGTSKGVGKY